ncbi:ubiquitin-60S ribosomal protein L40-like protein [Tanacetum coccineum]
MESTPHLVFRHLTLGTPTTPSDESLVTSKPNLACTTRLRVFNGQNSVTMKLIFEGTADQDHSPSGAHFEHESLVTPKPKLAYITTRLRGIRDQNSVTKKMTFDNLDGGDSEFLTPSQKLLNVIDKVEKLFMQELNNLKRTPAAKKAEREKRVRTLMSMSCEPVALIQGQSAELPLQLDAHGSSAAAPVFSTGLDVSNRQSNSGQSQNVCGSPKKLVANGKCRENRSVAKGTEDSEAFISLMYFWLYRMTEAKKKTQTPATSLDIQSTLSRCENLKKEVRSLKLNLAFMNRKDSEQTKQQTKQIEELQQQNEDMEDEKESLLEEIERISS